MESICNSKGVVTPKSILKLVKYIKYDFEKCFVSFVSENNIHLAMKIFDNLGEFTKIILFEADGDYVFDVINKKIVIDGNEERIIATLPAPNFQELWELCTGEERRNFLKRDMGADIKNLSEDLAEFLINY